MRKKINRNVDLDHRDIFDDDIHDEPVDVCKNTYSVKLAEKQKNINKDKEVIRSDKKETEYMCSACYHIFYAGSFDKEIRCPHCGFKYIPENEQRAENIRAVILDNKAKSYKERQDRGLKDVDWQDGRKEQISLELGSSEYQEYVEDIQNHDPMKPDDEMHQKLEQHNESLVTKLYEKLDKMNESKDDFSDNAAKIQVREEQAKRAMHTTAVRRALASASLTASLSDDQMACAITTDNPILYDNSVKADDYADALNDYVQECTK